MESLVDYEDSDSESDSLYELGWSKPFKQNQDMTGPQSRSLAPAESHAESIDNNWTLPGNDRNLSALTNVTSVESHSHTEAMAALPQSLIGCEGQYTSACTDKAPMNNSSRVAMAPTAPLDTLEKTYEQQTSSEPSEMQRRISVSVKRPQHVPSGVWPYISKRHRLGPSSASQGISSMQSVEDVSTKQTRSAQMLSEVSERVKPYLLDKPDIAGFPRRLLKSLEGHMGPVNTIHWCPVAQLSHLLLSASMDKTVKVWDGVDSGQCLRVYPGHAQAVRDACWSPCGRRFLTGSFDNKAALTDLETGQQVLKVDNQFKVMCVAFQPADHQLFLCGGFSPTVKAWDARVSKAVKLYTASIQQTLDILFLKGGAEFITSTDSVSRDSAERTLIAWDYQTTARLSNQIFHVSRWFPETQGPRPPRGPPARPGCQLGHCSRDGARKLSAPAPSQIKHTLLKRNRFSIHLERKYFKTLSMLIQSDSPSLFLPPSWGPFGAQERYTCPSLALHPAGECFLAQTNGNYMAVFSSQRPYRMNKRRRYEGHKVEGYAVQCELSADGTILATGSSTGSAHFYDYQSARTLHTLRAHTQPCLRVAQHPVLPATAATCDWGGDVKVWH